MEYVGLDENEGWKKINFIIHCDMGKDEIEQIWFLLLNWNES